MKITCDSCGSKYTIADAKVQGKKVKVRCKGCKESILVDGTKIGEGGSDDDGEADAVSDPDAASSDAPAEPAAAAAADPEPPAEPAPSPAPGEKKDKNLWSVNLTDDDSRDMTLDELVAGWKNGTVTSDAYVWKDGMGDWKPILEVGELKLKLGSLSKKDGGVVSSASPAAAAAAGGGGKMDDLFGGTEDAAGQPSEVELPAAGGEEKPTGARNDSSVLFSLDSLTGGDAPAPAKQNSGNDLFAGLGASGPGLAGNTDLLTAPAKDPPPAPAGNRAAAAPATDTGKGKGGLIAAILGAAVIVGGAAFFMSMGGDEEEKKDASAEGSEESAEAKAAAEKAKKELEEKMAKLEKMEAELKKAKEEALKKGEDPEEAAKKKQEELEKEKEEAEKKEAEAKKDGGTASASGSTTTKSDSGTSAPAPSTSKPPFDIGAAKAALSAAAANAAACKKPDGPTGSGKVQITFSTSGRVTSATVVSGPFGGTAVGGCVASTFRRARVPAFSGSPKTVAKSFRIN